MSLERPHNGARSHSVHANLSRQSTRHDTGWSSLGDSAALPVHWTNTAEVRPLLLRHWLTHQQFPPHPMTGYIEQGCVDLPPVFTSNAKPCFAPLDTSGSLTATSWLYSDSASTLNASFAPAEWPARSTDWSGTRSASSRSRRTSTTAPRPSDPPWTSRSVDPARECRSR